MKFPSTPDEWTGISRQFWRMWHFPNCLVAIDGKHVAIQAPVNSGSMYYNYKGTHSIILLAICDANYRFILVDIGEAGKESDSGVFSNSVFGQSLESNALPLPQPSDIVGDEGFPLRNNLLRPYPGRNLSENKAIFNYRSSRARRIIENSFGILAARFRIFHHPINATPDKVVAFIKATIVLHNFLRVRESSVYCPPGFVDGEDGEGNVILGEWRTQTGNASAMQRIG